MHFIVLSNELNVVFDILQWAPHDTFPASISNATYSCDSQLVYASFCDGAVGVFDAENLQPRCRLAPSVFLSPGVSR